MKNVFAVTVLTLGLTACGSRGEIDVSPDPSGNGGNGGAMGNGSGGGDAGSSTCNCPTGDGTRLTRQSLVANDGSKMPSFVWYDKKLDTKCSFQSLPNGETRCVPPHVVMNAFFDAACTLPAFVWVYPAGQESCNNMPEYARFDRKTFDACDSSTGFDMYHMDLANDQSNLLGWRVLDSDGACKPASGSGKTYKIYGVYKVGDQDTFVKATEGVGF